MVVNAPRIKPWDGEGQLFYAVYNLALDGAMPAIAAYMLYRLLVQRKGLGAVRNWFGDLPSLGDGTKVSIWVHAVSVGEVMVAQLLLSRLRQLLPESRIMLTTVTDAGNSVARKQVKEADAIAYLPIDHHWAVSRAIRHVRPDALVLIEGELWPNLIRRARANLAAVVLANGRVSDATYRRAMTYARPFYRAVLEQFDAFLMRTQMDAERIIAIGADENRVTVTGDIKLDVPLPDEREQESLRMRLLNEFGLSDKNLVWVAGSTHQGEEEMLLCVYRRLLIHFPTLRLVIAPRHVERSNEIAALISRHRYWCVRRTALLQGLIEPRAVGMACATPVFLLDTMGELRRIYAMATVAFVGGSLIRRGGHNVIEPIVYGCPVVYGKHVDNFRPHAAALQSEGIGFMANDLDSLERIMTSLLSSHSKRVEIKRRSRLLLQAHSGAATRAAQHILELATARRVQKAAIAA